MKFFRGKHEFLLRVDAVDRNSSGDCFKIGIPQGYSKKPLSSIGGIRLLNAIAQCVTIPSNMQFMILYALHCIKSTYLEFTAPVLVRKYDNCFVTKHGCLEIYSRDCV